MTTAPDIKIISFSQSGDLDIAGFLRLMHPRRKNLKERMAWFTFSNPFIKDRNLLPGLLAKTDTSEIIGQFNLNNTDWYWDGKQQGGYLGYDFFVKEEYRTSGIGALLLMQATRKFKPFFGVGLTSQAKQLYDLAKIREIGCLRKFLWLNRPFYSIAHFLYSLFGRNEKGQPVTEKSFPEHLEIGGKTFTLLTHFSEVSFKANYDPRIIEFSRSSEFLNWRFFNSPLRYYFYSEIPNGQSYFVLREAVRKGLRLLSLVDYKTPVADRESCLSILKLVKVMARQLSYDGVMTASSQASFDTQLKKEGFFCVGKPAPIVSTIAGLDKGSQPGASQSVSMTMADADLDLNFGEF